MEVLHTALGGSTFAPSNKRLQSIKIASTSKAIPCGKHCPVLSLSFCTSKSWKQNVQSYKDPPKGGGIFSKAIAALVEASRHCITHPFIPTTKAFPKTTIHHHLDFFPSPFSTRSAFATFQLYQSRLLRLAT